MGIKHFRTYLEGSTFTVQKDHNPLVMGDYPDGPSLSNQTTLQLFTVVGKRMLTKGLSRDQGSLAKVGGAAEALVAETVPNSD